MINWTGVESWIKTGTLGYSTSAFFEKTSNICGEAVELEIGGASSESYSFPIYCFYEGITTLSFDKFS